MEVLAWGCALISFQRFLELISEDRDAEAFLNLSLGQVTLPPITIPPSKVVQIAQTQITADTAYNGGASDGVFHDLPAATLSITTTTGTHLKIIASVSAFCLAGTNGLAQFQVLVDGVQPRGCAVLLSNFAYGGSAWPTSISTIIAVAAGAHTVKLQWKGIVGAPHINAATAPDSQFATIIVEEIVIP